MIDGGPIQGHAVPIVDCFTASCPAFRYRCRVLALAQQLLARRKPVEDDRLLRLFWNRAELKREFAKLQRERERMLDQLRQQDGAVRLVRCSPDGGRCISEC